MSYLMLWIGLSIGIILSSNGKDMSGKIYWVGIALLTHWIYVNFLLTSTPIRVQLILS